jgi:hypothetical protein
MLWIMNRPSLRLSTVMEAIAALAILLAFWGWRLKSYYRTTIIFDCVTVVVTLSSFFIIATLLSGAAEGGRPGLKRWSRRLGILNILIAFWFISVEGCWFFETCPNCHRYRHVFEYRFLSLVLHSRGRELPTLVEWVAADLGTPCSHEKASRLLKQRWSGLCLLTEDPGDYGLYDPPWYPPCARKAVQSWLAQVPGFAQTFRKRVLEEWDRPYWQSLILKMLDACPPEQHPQHRLPYFPLPRDQAAPEVTPSQQ